MSIPGRKVVNGRLATATQPAAVLVIVTGSLGILLSLLWSLLLPLAVGADGQGRARAATRQIGFLHELDDRKAVDLSICTKADDRIRALAPFTTVEYLDLGGSDVTDAGLRYLPGFKRLRKLNLFKTRISDARSLCPGVVFSVTINCQPLISACKLLQGDQILAGVWSCQRKPGHFAL